MEKLNLARPALVEQGDYSVVGKMSFRNGVRPHLLLLAFPLKTPGEEEKEKGESMSSAEKLQVTHTARKRKGGQTLLSNGCQFFFFFSHTLHLPPKTN